jgi:hypothetical protein
MNGYNSNTNGTRRPIPLMVMPNGQVIFHWELDDQEQKLRRSEQRNAKQHPQTGGCSEEQTKVGCDQARAKSLANA